MLRLHFFLPDIHFGENEFLPLEKYDRKINISFCFNGNWARRAGVAIKSLLEVSTDKCDYNIFCVVDKSVSQTDRKLLIKLMKGTGSTLTFLNANHDFDKSYLGKWSVAIYYRMMLPKLLPNLDKIIYADIDVLFCNDLI